MADIRLFDISDYDAVLALWKSMPGIGLRERDDSRDGIMRFLQRNPHTNFVARAEGRIVGVMLCGHDGRRAYIYHAAVNPDYSRQGIASALLNAVMAALEKENIHKTALVVFNDNDLGNKFWEKAGFQMRDDLVYRDRASMTVA